MKLKTLTPAEAQGYADAFAKFNPSLSGEKRFDDVPGCTYATWEDVAAWFILSKRTARLAAMQAEAVSGWFESQDGDDPDADEDGDLVSTPCYDPSNTLGEIVDFLDDCSRSGLLLVDPRFFN